MLNHKLNILLIIVIFLVAVVATQKYAPQLIKPVTPYQNKFQKLKIKTINSIIIAKENKLLEFKLENNYWTLNSKRVDQTKINNLTNALLPTKTPDLISQTNTKHADFSLTASAAASVKLNQSLTILVGKDAPSGGIYARFDNEPNVYIINNLTTSDFNLTPVYWLDKTIFTVDKSKITKLTFSYQNKNTALVKNKDIWSIENSSTTPNKDKLEEILTTISNFIADSIPETDQLNSYPTTLEYSLTVTSDKTNETFQFYPRKSDILVNRQSDEGQFIISTAIGDKILEFIKSL